MDVITLLKTDHKNVANLLTALCRTENHELETRVDLFEKLEKELLTHTKFEETLFYPSLKKNPKTREMILEAYQEHHLIDHILAEMTNTSLENDIWKAKLMVLKENIAHHVKEEEQHIFPMIKNLLSAEELKMMGKEHQEFYAQMKKTKFN